MVKRRAHGSFICSTGRVHKASIYGHSAKLDTGILRTYKLNTNLDCRCTFAFCILQACCIFYDQSGPRLLACSCCLRFTGMSHCKDFVLLDNCKEHLGDFVWKPAHAATAGHVVMLMVRPLINKYVKMVKLPVEYILKRKIQYATVSHKWTQAVAGAVGHVVSSGANVAHYCNGRCSTCYACKLYCNISNQDKDIFANNMKAIGEKYQLVWIDLFCINQTAPEDKLAQIANMGTYYRCSSENFCFIEGIPGRALARTAGDYARESNSIGNNWNERGWLVQEVSMSPKVSVLFNGSIHNELQYLDRLANLSNFGFDVFYENTDVVSEREQAIAIIRQMSSEYRVGVVALVMDYANYWKAQYIMQKAMLGYSTYKDLPSAERLARQHDAFMHKSCIIASQQMLDTRAPRCYLTVAEAVGKVRNKKFTEERDRLLSISSMIRPQYRAVVLQHYHAAQETGHQDAYRTLLLKASRDNVEMHAHLAYSLQVSYVSNCEGIGWAQTLEGAGMGLGKYLMFNAKFVEEVYFVIRPQLGSELLHITGVQIGRTAQRLSCRWRDDTMGSLSIIANALVGGTHTLMELDIGNGKVSCLDIDLAFGNMEDNKLRFVLVEAEIAAKFIRSECFRQAEKAEQCSYGLARKTLERFKSVMLQNVYIVKLGNINLESGCTLTFGYLVEHNQHFSQHAGRPVYNKVGIYMYKSVHVETVSSTITVC